MKHLLVLVTCATVAASGETAVYRITPVPGDKFTLEVEKTGLLSGKKHLFAVERYQGTVRFDSNSPANSMVELEIDSNGLVLKDEWLSKSDFPKVQEYALKDMLAANEHPKITFQSTKMVETGPKTYDVSGGLTIRGKPLPATIRVTMTELGTDKLKFQCHSVIRMKDYGLKPPSAALGLVGTKNEMSVSADLTATSERPAAPAAAPRSER